MSTLKVTHKSVGVEVRRAPYEIEVDGTWAGSVAMNNSVEIAVAPGRHTIRLRSGRNSSRRVTFTATDGDTVAYRCTGKRILPLFLASFLNPALALVLVRVRNT